MSKELTPEEIKRLAFDAYRTSTVPAFMAMTDEALQALVASVWQRAVAHDGAPDPGHPDDIAVDRFAAAMKAKLAASRAKGRGGWDDPQQCTVEHLARLLVEHIPKGDPVDVANFAMMLHQRGADRSVLAAATPEPVGEPIQGGLDNDALLNAWRSKLPGVTPTDAQMTAFALGVEVGFAHARMLERADWSRVHEALQAAGVHPGRTDDHLADVIENALLARSAPAETEPVGEPVGKCLTLGEQEKTCLRDPFVWFGELPRGELLYTRPAAAPAVPEGFALGQWWVAELDSIQGAGQGLTPVQYRAINIARGFVREALAAAQAKGGAA